MPERAVVALGANLVSRFGEPRETLDEAVRRLGALGLVTAVSGWLETEPVGFTAQPRFWNGVLLLDSELGPVELLHGLLRVEAAMGRVRGDMPPKGPRTIDLDLIAMGERVVDTPELTLPHPAMAERRFVLEPLVEVWPEWVHPVLRRTAGELLCRLPA